jgi:hypothetical protein
LAKWFVVSSLTVAIIGGRHSSAGGDAAACSGPVSGFAVGPEHAASKATDPLQPRAAILMPISNSWRSGLHRQQLMIVDIVDRHVYYPAFS